MTAPVRAITTPSELADFYESLLDDAPDRDLTYELLSQAKNRIESENKLYVLDAEDTSKSLSIGQTYTTEFALPDNWRETRYIRVGTRFFRPTSYANRAQGQANRYFINAKARTFGFTGSAAISGTIYHGYMEATDDFVEANEDDLLTDLLPWPSEYFPIIAFEAAGFYATGVDVDDISARQGAVNVQRSANLMDSFIGWDQDLKLEAQDNRAGFESDEPDEIDVGSLPGV